MKTINLTYKVNGKGQIDQLTKALKSLQKVVESLKKLGVEIDIKIVKK